MRCLRSGRSSTRLSVAALSLSLGAAAVSSACSATPTSPERRVFASASASSSDAANAAPPAFARAPRTYRRGDRATPVVDEAGPFRHVAASPDGLLVAVTRSDRRGVYFVDTDRGRVVGRAAAVSTSSVDDLSWRGDDALFATSYSAVTELDGKTGRVVASVPGARPGVVRVGERWAVLVPGVTPGAPLTLAEVARPEHAFARVPAVDALAALDLGRGAFAVVTREGLVAFEADGKRRWEWANPIGYDQKVEALGDGERVVRLTGKPSPVTLLARDGTALASPAGISLALDGGELFIDGARVREQPWGSTATRDAAIVPEAVPEPTLTGVSPGARVFAYGSEGKTVFADREGVVGLVVEHAGAPVFGTDELPHALVSPEAVYALRDGAVTVLVSFGTAFTAARIVSVGDAGFAARCDGGATATLGRGVAVPADLLRAPPEPTALTTSDGAYRVTWNDKLVITTTRDGSTRELDLAPIVGVALRPDDKTAIVTSHLGYVGNGWIADPDATIHFVDLPSAKVSKDLPGDDCTVTPDGKRLIVSSHEDVVLYDAATYRQLRRWRGQGNAVALDPTDHFALVFRRAKVDLGPLHTSESFVEDLSSGRRVIDLHAQEGSFVFHPSGTSLAFVPGNGYPDYGEATSVHVYDLIRPGPPIVIDTDEPIGRVEYLARGRVLAIHVRDRVVLHRMLDHHEVSIHAVPEGSACRLFAVDASGHFTGDPGGRLGLRFGDDLRESEIVTSGPPFDAMRDEQLLDELFAATAAP